MALAPAHPIALPPDPAADPWGRLFADVKIDIPSVTNAVFQQVLFRTWKDFCDSTNIWTEDIQFWVGPNALSYPVPVRFGGVANRLLLVYDPAMEHPDKKWVQGGVTMSVPGVINLTYAPSSETIWSALIAKTPHDPTHPETNFPDMRPEDYWIVDKYREALYFGILGRLQASTSKPYSNPGLAKYNLQNYRTERNKARTDATKANVFGGQRWMFPQSFATIARKGWV
jgi:hypothetical protein